ncbi:MAG: shikimate kinase [Clostridia bacterium]|nr:shikimate kinase [Clostridia bacterium]
MNNIVLVGMPGSGKTTIGRTAAAMAGVEFTDIDEAIESEYGRIESIFSEKGEKFFRDIEFKEFEKACAGRGIVISTGGGIVEREENVLLMKKNTVVFIDRDIDRIVNTIDNESRPLLKNEPGAILRLYERRIPLYLSVMDFRVGNNGEPEDSARILKKIIEDKLI